MNRGLIEAVVLLMTLRAVIVKLPRFMNRGLIEAHQISSFGGGLTDFPDS